LKGYKSQLVDLKKTSQNLIAILEKSLNSMK
jgi:hypothetical protein